MTQRRLQCGMQWEMRFLSEHQVLEFVTSGDITVPDLEAMIVQGVAESQRRGSTRVLVDHRNAVNRMGTMQIYETPERERAAGVGGGDRVAFVVARDDASREDFHFYENRSVNAGNDRRVFVDRAAALAWLTGPAAA